MRSKISFMVCLAFLLVLMTGLSHAAPAAGLAGNAIEKISYVEDEGFTRVQITCARNPSFTVFRLEHPVRIFIDIADGNIEKVQSTLVVENGVVDRVGTLQFRRDGHMIGRVIVGLNLAVVYDVRRSGNVVEVLVDASARKPQHGKNFANEEQAKYEVKVAKHRQEIERLHSQIKEEAARVGVLRTQRVKLEEQRESLNADVKGLAERRIEMEALEGKAANLESRLAKAQSAMAAEQGRRDTLAQTVSRLKALEDNLQDSSRRLSESRKAEVDARAKLKKREAELSRTRGHLKAREASLEKAKGWAQNLEDRNQKLLSRVDDAESTADKARKRMSTERAHLDGKVSRIKDEAETLRSQVGETEKRLKEAEATGRAGKAEAKRLRELRKKLEQRLKQEEAARQQREMVLTRRIAEIDAAKGKLETALRAQRQHELKLKGALQDRIKSLEARVTALNDLREKERKAARAKAVLEARTEARAELEAIARAKKKTRKAVETLRRQRVKREKDLAKLDKTLARQHKSVNRIRKDYSSAEKQLGNVRAQVNAAQAVLAALDQQRQELRREINTLEARAENHRDRKKQEQQKLERLELKNRELAGRVKGLEEQVSFLQTRLNGEREGYEQRVGKMRAERKSLDGKIRSLDHEAAQAGKTIKELLPLRKRVEELGRKLSNAEQEHQKQLRGFSKQRTDLLGRVQDLEVIEAKGRRSANRVTELRTKLANLQEQTTESLDDLRKRMVEEVESREKEMKRLRALLKDGKTERKSERKRRVEIEKRLKAERKALNGAEKELKLRTVDSQNAQKDLRAVRAELAMLRARTAKELAMRISEANRARKVLEQERARFQKERSRADQEILSKDEKVTDAQRALDAVKKELVATRGQAKKHAVDAAKARTQVSELRSETLAAKARVEKLRKTLENARDYAQRLKHSTSSAEQRVTDAKSALQERDAKLVAASEAFDQLRKAAKSERAAVEKAQVELKAREAQLKAARDELNQSVEQAEKIRRAARLAQEQAQSLKKMAARDLESLEQEKKGFQKERDSFVAQKRSHDESVARFSNEAKSTSVRITKEKAAGIKLRAETERLRAESERMKLFVEEVQAQSRKAQADVLKLRLERKEVERGLRAAKEAAAASRTEIVRLKNEAGEKDGLLVEARAEVRKNKVSVDRLASEKKVQDDKLRYAEKEAAKVRRRLSRANAESALREKYLATMRGDLHRAKDTVVRLEREVQESRENSRIARESAKKADSVVRELRSKLETSEGYATRLGKDRAKTQSSIGLLEKKIARLEKTTRERRKSDQKKNARRLDGLRKNLKKAQLSLAETQAGLADAQGESKRLRASVQAAQSIAGAGARRAAEAEVRAKAFEAKREKVQHAIVEAVSEARNKAQEALQVQRREDALRFAADQAKLRADVAAMRQKSAEAEKKAAAEMEMARVKVEEANKKVLEAKRRAVVAQAEAKRKAAVARAEAKRKAEVAQAKAQAKAQALAAKAELRSHEIAERSRRESEKATKLVKDLETQLSKEQNRAEQLDLALQKVKKQESALVKIQDVRFESLPEGPRVVITADRSFGYDLKQHGGGLQIDLHKVELPKNLQRVLDTRAFQGAVFEVASYQDAKKNDGAHVALKVAPGTVGRVLQAGKKLVLSFAGVPGAPQTQVAGARWGAHGAAAASYQAAGQAAASPAPAGGSAPVASASGGSGGGTASAQNSFQYVDPYYGRRHQKRRFMGRKINLTIKDADIQHVLTFLAKEGNINIITSADVEGEVSFHFDNVPWDLALEMVLKSKGLDYVREEGVYRIAPAESIQKEFEMEIEKRKKLAEFKQLIVKLIPLSYASAGALAERVAEILSEKGTVGVDERTNTLVIKDVEEHVVAAEDLVGRLDSQTPQVLIEARIVEATDSFSEEMGLQWGGNYTASPAFGNETGLMFPSTVGISGGAGDGPSGGLLDDTPAFAVNMPAGAGVGSGGAMGLSLANLAGNATLNLRLSAAEKKGKVKIVSSPRITTTDNKQARISQGIEIPVQVVSAAGANTQMFPAELSLEVTPHVTPDGNIYLTLQIKKQEPDFGNRGQDGVPPIHTKDAATELLVKDGETAVIGGIFTRNSSLNVRKVPVLADLPLIGWMFRQDTGSDTRSELMIFITPRIVNRDASRISGGS